MERPTIKAAWDKFLGLIVPKEASPEQIQHAQAMFYAGAASMFGMLTEIADGADDEDEACTLVDGVDRELKTYLLQIMREDNPPTTPLARGH